MKLILVKLGLLISFLAYSLYSYIDHQNSLTQLKIEIFELAKSINYIKEENAKLLYEVEIVESPLHLLQLSQKPQFAHLKHPFIENVLHVKEGIAVKDSIIQSSEKPTNRPLSLAVGR